MGPLFPTWLLSQVNILELDISNASIFDRLPDWFATTFSKATSLSFSNNGINGTLPTNLESMISLQELYLDSNQLTGPIPLLPVKLRKLDISRNHLSGQLPSNICDLNVDALNLANNHLKGKLAVCNQQRWATMLILGNNMLSGKLQLILETYT
jgi:Leucine-rich repeat (LRR) protein